jgi:hypothetical protein
MAKTYEVWIEIQEIDTKTNCASIGAGFLPDCIGFFEGKSAKRLALQHISDIVKQHGIDPENSDAVKFVNKIPLRKRVTLHDIA